MRIFLSFIIIFSFFQNLSAQRNEKTASRIVSAELLEGVIEKNQESTLLVVLKTYLPELKRINKEINNRNPDNKNYGYLLRRKEGILEEKSSQDLYNQNLIQAFKSIAYITNVYFIPDTALSTVLKTLSCECQSRDFSINNIDLNTDNLFYFQEGLHPETRTRGYYFYSPDTKYLDTPFPDYISAASIFDSLMKAFFPSRQSRKSAQAIVKRINTQFYRAWGNQLARREELRSIRS